MSDSKVKGDQPNSDNRVEVDQYDRGIIPAETAARIEREGANFKSSFEDEPADPDSIDTSGGYTVDKEGLANNYAIEPEMYYEEPGDLKAIEEAEQAERAAELAEINDNDEDGKLTMTEDKRGKGPGII